MLAGVGVVLAGGEVCYGDPRGGWWEGWQQYTLCWWVKCLAVFAALS